MDGRTHYGRNNLLAFSFHNVKSKATPIPSGRAKLGPIYDGRQFEEITLHALREEGRQAGPLSVRSRSGKPGDVSFSVSFYEDSSVHGLAWRPQNVYIWFV